MIYLITGNMGTGKTSRVVNMILTNEDGLFTHTLSDGSISSVLCIFAILMVLMLKNLMLTN